MLDADADRLCAAQRLEHSPEGVDTRAGHHKRQLPTTAGDENPDRTKTVARLGIRLGERGARSWANRGRALGTWRTPPHYLGGPFAEIRGTLLMFRPLNSGRVSAWILPLTREPRTSPAEKMNKRIPWCRL